MEKIKLLTGAHLRKNKSTAIGLFILMLLASMLISCSFLLFTDVYPTAEREAKRLNAGDGFFRFSKNIEGIDDEAIKDIMGEDVDDYEAYHCLNYKAISIPFGANEIVTNVQVVDDSILDNELGRTEIITEDKSIKKDYIYLPYQYYTSKTCDIGDTFTIELLSKKYDFTVKGFTNTTYFGCNNCGAFEYIVDDDSYKEIYERDGSTQDGIVVLYDLKDDLKQSKFEIRVCNDLLKVNADTIVDSATFGTTINGRTFMSLIIAVSFLSVSVLVLLVIILMLVNSITNYIRENMQTIGALKAIGYTSGNIKTSLLFMFALLGIVGSVIGVAASYLVIPYIAEFVVIQMGVPYNVSFNLAPSLIAFAIVVCYVLVVTMLSVAKIRRIDPIIALRDGVKAHNFKKNRVRLERSPFGLNVSLALKTMFGNTRQNVITFVVTGVIVFLCVIALLMYENFNRNPKLEMLSFEICGGVAAFDYETKDEARQYLEERTDVENVRNMINVYYYYNDEDRLNVNIIDDIEKLNNRSVCYEGRLPKYDNEIAISGKFCKEYGFDIGDEIKLEYGDESYSYLISGFIQTTNNNGKEAVMIEKAAEHVMDLEYAPAYYYFDCDGPDTAKKILDECAYKFDSHLMSTINFSKVVEGSMTTFKSIASLMLIVVCIISALVILLVLYLLIKAFLYGKRRDYGVCKAIGYTSNNLILQTAISFMPPIILSVILCSIGSYYGANPYMNVMMGSFGIVKADFDIPIPGVIITGVGIVAISFLFAIFEARRIKKMEAYKILVAE